MLVDHDESSLAWREAGQGPVVVFLHGLGGSRTAWDPQLHSLSDRFRCVAWDMPGYGRSAPRTPLTFPVVADALADLLDLLQVDRAHLVGESFGGMQAVHTALRYPDRIDRLVLTNTSPAFGMNGTEPDEWRRARLEPLDDGQEPAQFASAVLQAISGPLLTGSSLQARIDAFGRISAAGLRAAIECLPTNDVRQELHRVAQSCLVIAGELDEETPPEYAEVLHAGLPRSRLVVLPGIGHLAASEAPDRFNELVRSFLVTESVLGNTNTQEPQP